MLRHGPATGARAASRRARGGAITPGARDWAELFDALRAEMSAGTDPADARLDPLRTNAAELIEAFAGRRGGSRSLTRMWSSEDSQLVSQGSIDRHLWAYYPRVRREPMREETVNREPLGYDTVQP